MQEFYSAAYPSFFRAGMDEPRSGHRSEHSADFEQVGRFDGGPVEVGDGHERHLEAGPPLGAEQADAAHSVVH